MISLCAEYMLVKRWPIDIDMSLVFTIVEKRVSKKVIAFCFLLLIVNVKWLSSYLEWLNRHCWNPRNGCVFFFM